MKWFFCPFKNNKSRGIYVSDDFVKWIRASQRPVRIGSPKRRRSRRPTDFDPENLRSFDDFFPEGRIWAVIIVFLHFLFSMLKGFRE